MPAIGACGKINKKKSPERELRVEALDWWRWREYPRTEKQSTGLFFAHCGAPSKFDASSSKHKLNTPYRETVVGVYLVEMAGVEPASENTFPQISTSVAVL